MILFSKSGWENSEIAFEKVLNFKARFGGWDLLKLHQPEEFWKLWKKSKYAMVMLPSLLSSTLPRNVIGRVDFVCFVCCLQHPAWGRNKTYYQYQTCFLNSLNLWNNCTLKIVVANIVLNRRAGRLLCCVCLCVCCVVWILGEDEVST